MYRSKKSPLLFHFFSWYIAFLIRKNFSDYRFKPIEINKDEAALVLANHFSWWDGFLMFQLNRLLFKKQFYILVGPEDYRKCWYLKYLGAFAPENNRKDLLATLSFAGKLLDDPNNLVLIFPQGRTYSSYVNSIGFEKGVMQIMNFSKKKFQVIFSACLSDFQNRPEPAVSIYLRNWEIEEYVSLQLIKSEYNKHYSNAVKTQNMSRL